MFRSSCCQLLAFDSFCNFVHTLNTINNGALFTNASVLANKFISNDSYLFYHTV